MTDQSTRDRDKRRRDNAPWRSWYGRKAWKQARRAQLQREPHCRKCMERGQHTAGTVVDHKDPHRGDWQKFIDPHNHQTLCDPCHDIDKRREELHGYRDDVGDDGWPTDPNHPANLI